MASPAASIDMDTGTVTPPQLYSVGHSNHELARLIDLLRGVSVTAVADVRSQPYSQRLPQFNRPELEHGLREHGIAYVFLGDLLGGRPADPGLYDAEGRADYDRIRQTPAFQNGLQRLLDGLSRQRIAMLCGEADPLDCHRGLMITPALVERDVAPLHLRRDGSVETTAEMERRLLEQTGVGEGVLDGLFAALVSLEERREYLREAYRARARRRAFRLRPGVAGREGGEDV